jgi:hypothetical protein
MVSQSEQPDKGASVSKAQTRRRPHVDGGRLTSRRRRVNWRRFEDGGGDAVEKRTVDDVGVASDPSDVGSYGLAVLRTVSNLDLGQGKRRKARRTAEELVSGVDVKDVFDGQSSTQKVSTGGVDDPLRLSSRSRGLMKEIERDQHRFGTRREIESIG